MKGCQAQVQVGALLFRLLSLVPLQIPGGEAQNSLVHGQKPNVKQNIYEGKCYLLINHNVVITYFFCNRYPVDLWICAAACS